MLNSARLPLHFRAGELHADLARIEPGEWIPHFNADYFHGDWSGVALRAPANALSPIFADPTAQAYLAQPALERCPYFREVIAAFRCPLRTVRLLRLRAGSSIREHRDHELGLETGEVRLHVPIRTNPEVEFYLDGDRVVMREGECWYLNLSLPHRVQNYSAADRVHLVIDCVLNDWLRELIVEKGAARSSGPACGFERFRRLVLADAALQASLVDCGDRETFTATALELGAERGCRFSAGDVEAALQAARRAWRERNV